MSAQNEIDVRAALPPRTEPDAFARFDALGSGEAFVLEADHDPTPLLQKFQAERPGRFEWGVLEAGPRRYRVEIRRRNAEGPRAVSEYLEADHRRLDAMIPQVEEALAAGSLEKAAARFAEFACGLNRHIDAEERILFPVFEQVTGMAGGGPTFVMRHEHVQIRASMDAATRALHTGDAKGALASIREMVETLGDHNVKEEQMLYPMTDRAVGDDQAKDELVKRLQTL